MFFSVPKIQLVALLVTCNKMTSQLFVLDHDFLPWIGHNKQRCCKHCPQIHCALLINHFVCKNITYILVDNFVYRTPSDLQKCYGSVCLRKKKEKKEKDNIYFWKWSLFIIRNAKSLTQNVFITILYHLRVFYVTITFSTERATCPFKLHVTACCRK